MNYLVLSFVKIWRAINLLYYYRALPWLNRKRLIVCKVELGKNVNIQAHCHLRIDKTAEVTIGNNVTITGAPLSNPLNTHSPIICVCPGATLKIGNGCGLSSPVIWCSNRITIKDGAGIGGNVLIMDSDAHSLDYRDRSDSIVDKANTKSAEICIGENSLIGANSIILKGVCIGAHSIIGAGSVVTKDIPADCIAGGNPCKVIKYMYNI